MQINIDKKTGTLLGVILVLILAVVFLLAGNSGQSMDHSGHGASSKDESSAEYSADEIMFAQMMIPHHEQAVTIWKWAENIVKSQSAEIQAMKALLG